MALLYRSLRAGARVALHWYYGDLLVQGLERVPATGPLLVVANHPNALVDAMLVAVTLRRRVLLTAKATLFDHPLLARLLHAVGVVPLRRAADARGQNSALTGAARNAASFEAVREALRTQAAVLVFPEGISHDAPSLAPLKTGAARMALDARAASVHDVQLLPIGLVYERKERPRSRVLVRIGEPIPLDRWCGDRRELDAAALTEVLDAMLRHVTLNFASDDRADRAIGLARTLTAVVGEPSALGRQRSLLTEVEMASRIDRATDALSHAPPALVEQADWLIARLELLESMLAVRRATVADVRISLSIRHGAWFLVREGVLALVALPVAVIGYTTHWLPLRLARSVAMRPLARDPSRDQPAMRTIVIALAFLLIWYLLLGAFLARWVGFGPALLGLVAIFFAARVEYLLRDRLGRVWRRARTYVALRRDPSLRDTVLVELDALVAEAVVLEQALLGEP
jgi:glycerol-3-phosphate O-acyltransferase/dihydroxyacetone phosphate acyltransferase